MATIYPSYKTTTNNTTNSSTNIQNSNSNNTRSNHQYVSSIPTGTTSNGITSKNTSSSLRGRTESPAASRARYLNGTPSQNISSTTRNVIIPSSTRYTTNQNDPSSLYSAYNTTNGTSNINHHTSINGRTNNNNNNAITTLRRTSLTKSTSSSNATPTPVIQYSNSLSNKIAAHQQRISHSNLSNYSSTYNNSSSTAAATTTTTTRNPVSKIKLDNLSLEDNYHSLYLNHDQNILNQQLQLQQQQQSYNKINTSGSSMSTRKSNFEIDYDGAGGGGGNTNNGLSNSNTNSNNRITSQNNSTQSKTLNNKNSITTELHQQQQYLITGNNNNNNYNSNYHSHAQYYPSSILNNNNNNNNNIKISSSSNHILPSPSSISSSSSSASPPLQSSSSSSSSSSSNNYHTNTINTNYSNNNYEINDLDNKGIVGLRNLGNTCFMNSILQCLSNTKCLLEYCLRGSYVNDLNTTLSVMKGSLFRSYALLIKTMWKNDDVVSPQDFKSQIARFAPRFVGYAQQDAEEFLYYLLKGLHEDVNLVKKKPTPIKFDENAWDRMSDYEKSEEHWSINLRTDNSRISEMFCGQLKSTLKCTKCDYRSPTYELFWHLAVPIPTKTSSIKLDDCLKLFMAEEILDGDNKPMCSRCKEKRRCTKRYTIERLPKILVIHLKRFLKVRYNNKINLNVDYPIESLDMSKYLSNNVDPVNINGLSSSLATNNNNNNYQRNNSSYTNCLYDLYGISLHSGTESSGHYVAYCKHPYNKRWHCFNDSSVKEIPNSALQDANAYILFYQLRS